MQNCIVFAHRITQYGAGYVDEMIQTNGIVNILPTGYKNIRFETLSQLATVQINIQMMMMMMMMQQRINKYFAYDMDQLAATFNYLTSEF